MNAPDAGASEPPTDQSADPALDTPQISGIVGRLPDHAVALVKRTSGGTRALGIGETVDGWRLESLAVDAALFVRGSQRVRVEVSAAAPAADQ